MQSEGEIYRLHDLCERTAHEVSESDWVSDDEEEACRNLSDSDDDIISIDMADDDVIAELESSSGLFEPHSHLEERFQEFKEVFHDYSMPICILSVVVFLTVEVFSGQYIDLCS